MDTTGIIFIAILVAVLALLGSVARRVPLLGLALGLGLSAVPVVQWFRYDPRHFHSEGSAAGLVLLFGYWILGLVSLSAGVFALRVSVKTLRGEEVALDRELDAHFGEQSAPSGSKPIPKLERLHERLDDAVWMTDADRVRGMLAQARKLLERGERVAISGYNATAVRALREASSALAGAVLDPSQLNPARLAEIACDAPRLMLLLAGASADPSGERLLLTRCRFRIALQVHHSLDDRALADSAGPKLKKLLETLGGTADGPIVHEWVSRAIEEARRKAP